MTDTPNEDSPQGLAFAVSAYVLWGFLPLYMKLLSHLSPVEVVAHRVIWSVPIAAFVLLVLGRLRDVARALRSPRMLALGCITAALVSLNWGIYIWAVFVGQAMDAALGYYMNPLFSVALGAVLLGERLRGLQRVAIALAAAAVLVLIVDGGGVPWAALGMMLTWGFYALGKKQIPLGANQGFMLEILILLPFALALVGWSALQGTSAFGNFGAWESWLLLGCGLVTAVPLMLYANGAKLLRLSTIAILQYIAPTLIFLVALFIFEEPFDRARAIAFSLIWLALILYSVPMIQRIRRERGTT